VTKPRHTTDLKTLTEHVLRNTDDNQIVVGPMVWGPAEGMSEDCQYFMVAASEEGRGFRCDQVVANESVRLAFLATLTQHRTPLVIHDVGDELFMFRLCEALWPAERITRLRRAMEAERNVEAH